MTSRGRGPGPPSSSRPLSPVPLRPGMRPLLTVLASLLAVSAPQGILYLEVNSYCPSVGNIERICKKLEDCPVLKEDIRRRKFPEICTFQGLDPVVCCPQVDPTTTTTTNPTPWRILPGEGEVCQDGAHKWYCRKQSDCPGFKEVLENGWGAAKTCSFVGNQPIVCCPPGGEVSSRPTSSQPATRPQWPSWSRPSEETRPPYQTQPIYPWQTRPSTYPTQTRPSTNSWQTRPQTNWPSWTQPTSSSVTQGTGDRENPVWGGNHPPTTEPGNGVSSPVILSSKSEEMCTKYGRFVYKKVRPPILLPGVEEREEAFCGRLITPLIVKGVDAQPREFPHMARIGYGSKSRIDWLCGGSLISERFILSAAHCTNPRNRLARWANLGDLDTSSTRDDATPITLEIVERFDHPDYKSDKALYHDISLYKLEKDAPLGIYIRPICLNTKFDLKETAAVASGWGHTVWGDSSGGSPMLQKVELKIVSQAKCNISYKDHIKPNKELPLGIHSRYMLCAGGHDGKDTCQGDSGGPLQIARRDPYCTYSIIGVTSFGKGCGTTTPGVYTNIAYYVPWIESIVWPT